MQNDINNPYLQKSIAFFKIDNVELWSFRLTSLMPFLARPFYISNVWLLNNVQRVIDLRSESLSTNSVKRINLLQLMMDASTGEKVIVRIFIEYLCNE
jgi:hypothetical protein